MAKILLNVEVNKSNLRQVEEQLNKVLNPSASTDKSGKKSAIVNIDNLRKSYANLLNQIKGAEKYFSKGTFDKVAGSAKKYQSELIGLNGTVKLTKEEAQKLTGQLNEVQREFAETKLSAKNMHGSLGEIVKGFAKFQIAAMLVMKPLQLVRNAWDSLNETLVKTEDAVVSLRRVAGDAANANELYDLAQRYGQTFDNVYEVATNFARAGYSWNETIKSTEAALLALNTAELDASQASEGMIAIMQQFGYEASDLQGIIDKLNITADNAAVSTEKLLTALQRTGSSAKNANLSLEQTVAIVTALSESTGRSGENIGTALNSLIQFSTKASSLDTFAKLGGDVEAVVERYKQGGATVLDIWKELSNIIKSNQANSAESVLGKGFSTQEFEALNEELKESFGETFAQTTEIYDTASTFRKNYFIALLQNLDQVQESLDTMQYSEGYSQQENLLYLDTYTAKVNALKAKWQEIANDEQGLLGIKKKLVDFAKSLLNIVDKLGGIKTIIQTTISIASPFLAKWAATFGVSAFKTAISGAISFWNAMRSGAISTNQALGAVGILLGALSTIGGIIESNEDAKEQALQEAEAQKKTNIGIAAGSASSLLSDLSSVNQTGDIDEQLNNWLQENKGQINNAQSIIGEQGFQVKTETGVASKLNELATKGGFGYSFVKDTEYIDNERIGEDIWLIGDLIGDVQDLFDPNGAYTEQEYLRAVASLGDREAALEKTRAFYDYIEKNYTGSDKGDLLGAVGSLISEINNEDYKQAKELTDYASKIQKYLSGEISYEELVGVSGSSNNTASNKTNLSDVVNKLEEIRENTEKTNELEEKQLALQEAQNQRTVRVFNAETGQWEMQANQQAIAEAEKELKDTAMDNIISYLSTEEAQAKLDAGEFTLPSWLSEMISKPTTNDAFQAFMTAMGIMSGAANKSPVSSGAVYNNSSTTNNSNSNTYNYNGVPISAEMANSYTVAQLAEIFGQTE